MSEGDVKDDLEVQAKSKKNESLSPSESKSNPVVKSKEEKASKFGNVGLGVFFFLLSTACSVVVGAASGYYAAMSIPVPNQVMVFDINAFTKKAANHAASGMAGGDPKAIGEAMLVEAHKKIDELTALGIVVIDKEMVVDAPKHLIINIDTETASGQGKKPLTQEEMVKQLKLLEQQLDKIKDK